MLFCVEEGALNNYEKFLLRYNLFVSMCILLFLFSAFQVEKAPKKTPELELLKDFQLYCLFMYWQMNWQLADLTIKTRKMQLFRSIRQEK